MEATMFEVGDRIVRRFSGLAGFVSATEKRRAAMVEIRWDATGLKQWLPAEEFEPWSEKQQLPPEVKTTSWGRTTPAYITRIRSSKQCKDERKNARANLSQNKLESFADEL